MTDIDSSAPIFHGGDLSYARLRWPSVVDRWIDLSTGINPWPWPLPALPTEVCANLPQKGDEGSAKAAISDYCSGLPTERIALVPGSQYAIRLIPTLFEASSVAVVSPTYGEHGPAWQRAGHRVIEVETLEQTLTGNQIVVVTNPNNPDGRHWSRDVLSEAAFHLANSGGCLVVDEAFADTDPSASMVEDKRCIVLRSFGKFFGLAGLRAGFVAGPREYVRQIEAICGPWSINGPALFAMKAAYRDHDWIQRTRSSLWQASKNLQDLLAQNGLNICGSTALFVLVEHDNAIGLVDRLGQQGILVRSFDLWPNWIRIGLPDSDVAFNRLSQALKEQ